MKSALFTGVFKKPAMIAVALVGALAMSGLAPMALHAADDSQGTQQHDGHDHGNWQGGRCARMQAMLDHMDKKLTPEQIHDIFSGRLAEHGEGTLKVGKVTAKGDVVSVDIVTNSGSLVSTRDISTKTGLPADLGKRCEEHEHMKGGQMDGHPGGHMGGPMGGHGFHHGGMLGSLAALGGGRGHDLNLSTDQVKKLADAALIMAGNPRLKVGAVKEKDADTITVDIVTVDNALVAHREVDRHNGHVHRAA